MFKKVCLSFLFLFLTACGSTVGETAESVSSSPLQVGWHPWPGYFPIVIADELDLFSKHGVNVDVTFYEGSSLSHPDLQAGKLDAATGTLADALLMDGRSPDSVRVVLAADYSDGGDVVVATQDVQSVADLRGKAVGANLGSFSELFILEMLKANGLTSNEVTLVNVEARDVPQTMPDTIQAGHTWEPQTSEALAQGHHILFSSSDTPGLIPDLVIFRREVTESRPDDVRGFVAAWLEAAQYWHDNPEAANQLIAEALDRAPDSVSFDGLRLFTLAENQTAFRQGTDTTSLYFSGQINAEFLVNSGGLDSPPNVDRLLDSSFLPDG